MNADSKSYFEDISGEWDQMRECFFSEKVREAACTIAEVQSGKSAADIGAGTGFLTEELLSRDLRVVAVDQSSEMLDLMQRKFLHSNDIEYKQAQADERIPLPDNSVDYAFANMYLHHVESPLEAIREMARITTFGGRVVITDLDAHTYEFLREKHHDRWMGFERDDITVWLKEAGLKEAGIDCIGEDCCDTPCDGTTTARISIFGAWGTKKGRH
ncbi:MAG: class I SAM-dependent methyltransferase [Candidatus Latescibacteria bacterium]|jgi:ubiquinone/menaquinone biosynthesis C-methylase UbiE|nr:class I SAM-dependent methyltransferase [Candidatus Latescibacterota bacterium]MDP7237253.1 class I SAM-dependent methyltransferase [Candidatus Latescibacterota bacterium]